MTASASISQWPCDQCNAGLPRLNSDDACPGRGCRLQLASSHFRCSECRLESNKIQLDRARGERSEFVEVWYCCRCDKGAFLVDERVKCAICSTQRCAGCNAIETEIWPSAINSPTVPRSNSDAFHAQRGDYRVRYHVRPFRPFIDKATDSSTLERRAPREPHPIDCAILKGWLDTCRQMHGGHCEPSSDYTRRPNWLVDATLKCVVAAGRLPYACLSYVWGNSSGDQLELANLPELRIPNSLASRSIPATVRDAFLIVEKLGLRYLWVDRLCIVQDVTGPKQQQISAMADIYANAEITIIAAQGHDSSVNLLPKEWIQPSNGEAEFISHDSIMHEMCTSVLQTKWHSRGWTWQEYFFSRRRLFFHGNTVSWDCHCASWHEGQGGTPENPPVPCVKQPGLALDVWPDMYRYVRMLSIYNPRDLTYPEDVFDAFEGALSTFGSSFPGGFISGLPRMFFDASLLWQPYSPIMRRRIPVKNREENIPSWSWAGFQGDVYSEEWLANCNCTLEDWNMGWEAADVVHTTDWLYSETLHGARESVAPEYAGMDPRNDPAWTQQTDELDGTAYFVHKRVPGQRFLYPIRINDRLRSEGLPVPIRARYLHASAKISRSLHIDEVVGQRTGVHPLGSTVMLRDKRGNWAGYVRPMHDEDFENIWGVDTECELVELSRSEVKNMGCFFLSRRGRMVNVMRVKREQGVYRRLGVGRIEEKVWDMVARTEDVTIG